MCALTKVITDVSRLRQGAVECSSSSAWGCTTTAPILTQSDARSSVVGQGEAGSTAARERTCHVTARLVTAAVVKSHGLIAVASHKHRAAEVITTATAMYSLRLDLFTPLKFSGNISSTTENFREKITRPLNVHIYEKIA